MYSRASKRGDNREWICNHDCCRCRVMAASIAAGAGAGAGAAAAVRFVDSRMVVGWTFVVKEELV